MLCCPHNRNQGVSVVGCTNPNVKVYALSANNGLEVRIVLVKKSGTTPATATVTIQGESSSGSFGVCNIMVRPFCGLILQTHAPQVLMAPELCAC